MGDHNSATGKIGERLLECAQCLDVEVVGGFVQQQYVAASSQKFRQVHPVAFAAGEFADGFLLVGAPEVEPRNVGTRGCLVLTDLDRVQAAGDLFPHGLAVIERLAALVDAGDFDGITHADTAVVDGLVAGQHPEQRGFARAVGSDNADDAARGQAE